MEKMTQDQSTLLKAYGDLSYMIGVVDEVIHTKGVVAPNGMKCVTSVCESTAMPMYGLDPERSQVALLVGFIQEMEQNHHQARVDAQKVIGEKQMQTFRLSQGTQLLPRQKELVAAMRLLNNKIFSLFTGLAAR